MKQRSFLYAFMCVWLGLCLTFWAWYLLCRDFLPQYLYYFLWLGAGALWKLLCDRHPPEVRAQSKMRFVGSVYVMVLLEESIAALCHHLSEPFDMRMLAVRIAQFWMLNIFTFAGPACAWAALLARYRYSAREVFLIAGFLGLFFERIPQQIFNNPLAVFLTIPLVVWAHGLVFLPATLRGLGGTRSLPTLKRYSLAALCILLASLPFILILRVFRTEYPGLFPPRYFIPI